MRNPNGCPPPDPITPQKRQKLPRTMRDYIPAREADLLNWSDNFNTIISTGYADYGLSAGQATAYDTLNTAFATAYALAINPSTRTPATVAAKDTEKSTLIATARQYAQIARKYPGITNELLSEAGLTVPDPIPSPIPTPTTKPVISLIQSNSLEQVIRYRDSVLSNPRSRPPGTIGMQVFVKVGATPPATTADCKYKGLYTRMPATVSFEPADAGETAWYLCQWVTAKGLVGPTSDSFSATVAA